MIDCAPYLASLTVLQFYFLLFHAVERSWIGPNAWDDHVPIKVALKVQETSVIEFVKDRMSR